VNPDVDEDVRLHVYSHFAETGRAPVPAETAEALEVPVRDVEAAYRRLAEARHAVLLPGSVYIWMANPFSALPTPFLVEGPERSWWGNCIWDAMGIPPMLGIDARISARCGDCGERMELVIRHGSVAPAEGVVHFAVPAAHWWDDIGYN
jgi:hypothetical protein